VHFESTDNGKKILLHWKSNSTTIYICLTALLCYRLLSMATTTFMHSSGYPLNGLHQGKLWKYSWPCWGDSSPYHEDVNQYLISLLNPCQYCAFSYITYTIQQKGKAIVNILEIRKRRHRSNIKRIFCEFFTPSEALFQKIWCQMQSSDKISTNGSLEAEIGQSFRDGAMWKFGQKFLKGQNRYLTYQPIIKGPARAEARLAKWVTWYLRV
jgi:hypothetical protein